MEGRTVVAVCSGKGGVGTSLVAASLAAAYARAGKKTLLFDLCPSYCSAEFFFGMESRALFGLSSYLEGTVGAEELLLESDALKGLWICPAPEKPVDPGDARTAGALTKLIDGGRFERIVFDLPASESALTSALAQICDAYLIVTSQNPASLYACEGLSARLADAGKPIRTVIDRFDLADLPSYKKGRTSAAEIIDRLHAPLIGIVPESYSLLRRSEEGLLASLYEEEEDLPFDHIAARLDGQQIPLFEGTAKERLRKKL